MKTATVTEFRSRMKEYLEEIEQDQDILILSGPKKKDFVVLTLELFNSMEETAHLLSTPANASRLHKSIAQVKAGSILVKEMGVVREHKATYKKTTKKAAKKAAAKKRKK